MPVMPVSPVAALAVDGLSLSFGALRVIEGLQLSVEAGERHAILGPNGAGKTSLFNLLTGDLRPSAGRIRFFGDDVTRLPSFERVRRGLRRTYQSSLLFTSLSVRSNLAVAVRGVSAGRLSFRPLAPDGDDARAVERLLQRAGLIDIADRPVAELSHGQQRQLEIGMALVGEPRLLLLDEPAAGLSPAEREELVTLLTGLDEGVGFVLIEHDLDLALRVAERMTVMHNGQVIRQGHPDAIVADPTVQAIDMGGAVLVTEDDRRPPTGAGRSASAPLTMSVGSPVR